MSAPTRERRIRGSENSGTALAIRNGLWNGLANVVGALSGVVGSIVIVRSLSTEAYGAFSYYIWLAGILVTAGTLAFPEAVTKITSELLGEQRHLEARVLSRCVTLGLASVNLVVSLGIFVWAVSTPLPDRTYLLVVAASLVPNVLAACIRSSLWGQQRYRRVTTVSTVASALQLAFVLLVSRSGWGAPGFVGAVLGTTVVQAIGLALALRPADFSIGVPLSLSLPSKAIWRRYFAFFVPSTLGLPITAIVWERSEVFFLAHYRGLEQVGVYNLAYTAFSLALALGWSLINGLYPAMSRDYGAGDWQQIAAKLRHGMILALLYAVPLTFGGWATLDGVMVLMYGEKMLPSALVGRVLLLGLLPGVIAAVAGVLATATGRIWLVFRVGVVMCLLNLGLDVLLIPRYGALGGAIANTTSQIVFAVAFLILVHRAYKIEFGWQKARSIVAIGALTTGLLPILLGMWQQGTWALVGSIAVGGGLYLSATWRSGYLRIFWSSEAPE